LQVVGTNVYQSEKSAAEHLIQQARQDEQSGRPSKVRLLWHKTQEEKEAGFGNESNDNYTNSSQENIAQSVNTTT